MADRAKLLKLNDIQKFLFAELCKVILNKDSNEFIEKEKIAYERLKSAIYAKFSNDRHLKVWEIVEKHFSGVKIELETGKKLSIPLLFNAVVCFNQPEFKGA